MQLKIKWGGGTLIEGYFKIGYSKGLYCKVIETADKYEVWSNLKVSKSYSNNFNNIPTGKKVIGNSITFDRAYSIWANFIGGYGEKLVVRFDFTNDGINCENISTSDIGATQHSGNENDFVFLGSVIKK